MSENKPVAEIAGAGLAGLAAAAALAQSGWAVRVHERGRELREIGAGLYLWQNALDAMREIGVYDKIAAAGVRSQVPRALLDHNHREINMRRGNDSLPELIVVLRTELHRILAECAIQHGAEIVNSSPVLGADPAEDWSSRTAMARGRSRDRRWTASFRRYAIPFSSPPRSSI